MKNHLLRLWRQHFVLDEGMLEIETTTLTPDIVLRTSGHVEKVSSRPRPPHPPAPLARVPAPAPSSWHVWVVLAPEGSGVGASLPRALLAVCPRSRDGPHDDHNPRPPPPPHPPPQFADLMVKDVETGECYRADKLLEAHIEKLMEDVTLPSARREELRKVAAQADAYTPEQLGEILREMGIRGACATHTLRPHTLPRAGHWCHSWCTVCCTAVMCQHVQ